MFQQTLSDYQEKMPQKCHKEAFTFISKKAIDFALEFRWWPISEDMILTDDNFCSGIQDDFPGDGRW